MVLSYSSSVMNTSELTGDIQAGVVLAHHICGPTSFVFNTFTCLLIISDSDSRGKDYRKYLASLQLSSTMADICLSLYTPFVQFNCRLLYSDSELAKLYDLVFALMLYVVFFFGVAYTYFTCVYYRRNKLLPPGTYFCFYGWKYKGFLASVLAFIMTVIGVIYYVVSTLPTSIEDIPRSISWVKQKRTFIVINNNEISYPALIFVIVAPLFIGFVILLMITQLIFEIKHGMARASLATKKYQTRAVYSLVLQGIVPSAFYTIPAFELLALHVYTLISIPDIAANNHLASIISVLAVNVMSLHAFAHSLTILGCSPSYRRTISSLGRKILCCRSSSASSGAVERITHAESSRRSILR